MNWNWLLGHSLPAMEVWPGGSKWATIIGMPGSAWGNKTCWMLLQLEVVISSPEEDSPIHGSCEEPYCLSPQHGVRSNLCLLNSLVVAHLLHQDHISRFLSPPRAPSLGLAAAVTPNSAAGSSSLLSMSSWPAAPSLSQGSLLEPLATSTL